MNKRVVKRGISKAEWLLAALEMLAEGGVSAVRVESLAKSLGIAKSGFYWHFTDRQDLLHELLDYWVHELTEVVTTNEALLALKPKRRLFSTAEMVLEHELGRYDMAFRQWALQDEEVARVVRRVNRIRLEFTRNALSELGFSGDDLEVRTMLFTCYQTWESTMFREFTRKRLRALISRRLDLLTSK
jgi:AcrR family transcriptional regulator